MDWRAGVRAALVTGALGGAASSCSLSRQLPACVEPPPDGGTIEASTEPPVLLAAGDIVDVDLGGAEATGRLIDRLDGTVATLGDNVNINGSLDDFLSGYQMTWGRHRWRTRPSVGNHDYMATHAAPYFAYFCSAAGTPFEGWYSYELAAWHIVVLNSECVDELDPGPGCGTGSAQVAWLAADLVAHPAACTLAYWHHPRFNSEAAGGDIPKLDVIWRALHGAGAELVLNGHVHDYQRSAPLALDGSIDRERGMRQFVVGTGGAELWSAGASRAGVETRIVGKWGILKLTLHPASYDWQFISVDGETLDSGSTPCH